MARWVREQTVERPSPMDWMRLVYTVICNVWKTKQTGYRLVCERLAVELGLDPTVYDDTLAFPYAEAMCVPLGRAAWKGYMELEMYAAPGTAQGAFLATLHGVTACLYRADADAASIQAWRAEDFMAPDEEVRGCRVAEAKREISGWAMKVYLGVYGDVGNMATLWEGWPAVQAEALTEGLARWGAVCIDDHDDPQDLAMEELRRVFAPSAVVPVREDEKEDAAPARFTLAFGEEATVPLAERLQAVIKGGYAVGSPYDTEEDPGEDAPHAVRALHAARRQMLWQFRSPENLLTDDIPALEAYTLWDDVKEEGEPRTAVWSGGDLVAEEEEEL